MRALVTTLMQSVALVALGGAVGLAANGLREDRLSVGRDYFPARKAEVRPAPASTGAPSTEAPTSETKATGLPQHDLQTISLEDAFSAFQHPDHRPGESDGKIFFIDARDDTNFNDGHIPGALQVDHYRLEKYLPDVLTMIESAEKLIVYCNGGNCEDSILVSHDLLEAKVPYEKIFLFEGGYKAWKAAGHPLE